MVTAVALGGVFACVLAVAPAEAASLPQARSYQAFVTETPCPFSEPEVGAPEYEHVVLANSEAEVRSQHVPSLYEVFAGCNGAGVFILRITVTSKGTVVNPRMVRGSGCAAADRCVLEAARSWQFWPARKNGRDVSSRFTVTLAIGG